MDLHRTQHTYVEHNYESLNKKLLTALANK